MKAMVSGLFRCLLVGLLAAPAWPDDIDIYLGRRDAGPLRVMLSIDFRSGVDTVLCDDASASACADALGLALHSALDLYGLTQNSAGNLMVERGADGVPDQDQPMPPGPAGSLAQYHWPGSEVNLYDLLRAALRVVLGDMGESLRTSPALSAGVEVGLMATHGDDCDGAGADYVPDYSGTPIIACSQGAYVLQGFTDISVAGNLDRLFLRLAAIPEPGVRAPWMATEWGGHPYKIRDIYFELFRYLSGQQVFNGFLGVRDYGSRDIGNLYHDRAGPVTNDVLLTLPDGTADQPLLSPDTGAMVSSSLDLSSNAVAGARYASPLRNEEECPRIHMVNALFGAASASHRDTNTAIATPVAAGGLGLNLVAGEAGDVALVAALSGSGSPGSRQGATGLPPVKSYFFANDISAASEALAVAGGSGTAHSLVDPRELVEGLENVFSEVLQAGGTMVAGATAVDVVDRRRGVGDIYLSMFQAVPGPLWRGNIKKLKLVEVTEMDRDSGDAVSRKVIVQAPLGGTPRAALSPGDGRILPDALTFWTDPAGVDVLAFEPSLGEVSGRDGRSVARGGAGQQVAGFLTDTIGTSNTEAGARQLYTLDPSFPGALLALDATMTVQSALSAYLDPADSLTPERELALIRWIRGQDAFDSDGDNNRIESRPWVLGDIVHSRPLPINYGARPGTGYSADNPDIRLFFGSNDGIFHMVKNTHDTGADPESGQESWAFIPPAMLAMQGDLAQLSAGAATPHRYGIDGEAVAFIDDRDGDGNIEPDEGDAVWVFVGQRRGGRGLYAFDMTDPDSPRFKWMIDNTTPGFDQLAMTFSTPRVARLDLGDAAPTPVLVFAGGYNGGWNGNARIGKDASDASDTIGNAIYVVGADDGRLVWKAVGPGDGDLPAASDQLHFVDEMTHSIPSPVVVIDNNGNGVEDRAYVGDSGGNVWRIELTESALRQDGTGVTAASNWFVTRLASLGGSGASDRRFFHAPDIVRSRDNSGEYTGVVIVAGNRASPRDTVSNNFAYLLKDHRAGPAEGAADPEARAVFVHDDLADITEACVSATETDCSAVDTSRGWKLQLAMPGEKGVSTPLVTNGTVFFTSYLPVIAGLPAQCAPFEGRGRVYVVRLVDGSPGLDSTGELDVFDSANRYRDLGPGMPGGVLPYGDQVLVPGKGIDNEQLLSVPGPVRWRTYWREEEVDTL